MEFLELRANDVIRLKQGAKVHFNRFEHVFHPTNSDVFSKKETPATVTIGQTYRNGTDASGFRARMADGILKVFVAHGREADLQILDRYLRNQVPDPKPREFIIPEGLYLVKHVYGDERLVHCETYESKPNERKFEVYFFQNSPREPDNSKYIELVKPSVKRS